MNIPIRQIAMLFCCALTAFRIESLAVAQSSTGTPARDPALRVLILSGGGTHDWRATASFLREILTHTGRFEVKITEAPVGITASTLAPFDVVVDDYNGPGLGREAEGALEAFVESGKGLVVTRAGLASSGALPPEEPAWPGLVKLAKLSWPKNAARLNDPSFSVITLQEVSSSHAVMRGTAENLRTGDRPLRGFVLEPGAVALAANEKHEPLLFASAYGQGRVFCTTLGHDLGMMQEQAFITTFLRGAEWAASRRVTLPGEIAMPGPGTNGVRVLIINGGHDHEASFYGLFSGYTDMGWPAVTDSKLAFQQDLRPKYDVLVFYDFTRDLDEPARKNLRDFVESGKGIVVLHHGILNFQKWPWWYEEVAGGLYRLEQQGSIPNSTVKFGEEHLITPAGEHPITDGIAPFRVTDETYKGLFISSSVQPLLLTDNPTSDRTVAWIGPCKTSRVVFIQLGHDHSPFRHPSYRALVHNSILWSAGKLNSLKPTP